MSEATRETVQRWVDAYRRAWESNRPEDVRALFAEDARYLTEPFAEPWVGPEAIATSWLGRRDEPGQTTFEYEVLGLDGSLGFVQARTEYSTPKRIVYHNLWVIRLAPDGRASEFTEWWMAQE